jgi:hypothetical protein
MCGGVWSFSATLSSSGLFSAKGGGGKKGIDCALAYLPPDTTIINSKKARGNTFNEKELLSNNLKVIALSISQVLRIIWQFCS